MGTVTFHPPLSLGGFKAMSFSIFFDFNNGWSCGTAGSEPLRFEITAGSIAVAFLAFDAKFDIIVDKGTVNEKTIAVTRKASDEAVNFVFAVNDGVKQKHTIDIKYADTGGKVYINGIMVAQR